MAQNFYKVLFFTLILTSACAKIDFARSASSIQNSNQNENTGQDKSNSGGSNGDDDTSSFGGSIGRGAGDSAAGEAKYIVVLKKEQVQFHVQSFTNILSKKEIVAGMVNELSHNYGVKNAQKIYSVVLHGGVYKMTAAQAQAVSADPQVDYVEKDQIAYASVAQADADWGLDRLDQASLPLDQKYNYENSSSLAKVNAYVIDTGILTTHKDFQGRASSGIDLVDKDADATDCNGHGTHVAGTIGGATYGVAKNVKLFGVRVLSCSGSGSYSDVIAGIEWVAANHVKPAVANMSLGGPVSQAVDDAIVAAVRAGVTFVVAAGNENADACNGSPSRVRDAISVGSSTKNDARSSFSNIGRCVDLFAPGTDIKSAWYSGVDATNTISGTSMASPHVAGAAALFLAKHPTATPAQVKAALVSGSLASRLTDVGNGSPNLLLNVNFILADSGGGSGGGDIPPTPAPVPTPTPIPTPTPTPTPPQANVPPRIGFSAAPRELAVQFTDTSVDSDGKIVSWNWDFGDGNTSTAQNPQHTYSSDGSYKIQLVIQDNGGASAKTSINLSVKKSTSSQDPCTDCTHASGSLNGSGASVYQPIGGSYQAAAGTHKFWLQGPANSDFDIYLYKKSGSKWVQIAKSDKASSAEQITYSGTGGTYRLKVISYSGSGKFDLWSKTP